MSKSAASGIVALIFLVLGFQAAIFFNKIKSNVQLSTGSSLDDKNDTVLISTQSGVAHNGTAPSNSDSKSGVQRTKLGGYPPKKKEYIHRSYESFSFDPNTISVADLTMLGLTTKQAESIDNYRKKGGKFRKKDDFAKMYVVSDTLFERLEPFIEIPKIEINGADTSLLKQLPGIGSYYAKKIADYRDRLGGFFEMNQLLEIDGFTAERLDGLKEYAEIDTSKIRHLELWGQSVDSLSLHPYIGNYAAKGIVRFRECSDTVSWTIDNLVANGILLESNATKLKRYQ